MHERYAIAGMDLRKQVGLNVQRLRREKVLSQLKPNKPQGSNVKPSKKH